MQKRRTGGHIVKKYSILHSSAVEIEKGPRFRSRSPLLWEISLLYGHSRPAVPQQRFGLEPSSDIQEPVFLLKISAKHKNAA